MRQHAIRNREKILEECGSRLVEDAASHKGSWSRLFGNDNPIKLEVGSGKGQFISNICQRDKDINFLACEGGYNVFPRILQKAQMFELSNLAVIPQYIADPCDLFEDGELSGIYLNFSDPWKKQTAHRRLTHRSKLEGYRRICRPGSALEFKTDNDELFEFSLEVMAAIGLKPETVVYDLYSSELAEDNIPTEYEEKFTKNGLKIKYLRLIFT